jgi:hypothetical protein
VKTNRVLVLGTRLVLFFAVLISFQALLLRLNSLHGHLAIAMYLLAGVVCTGYCSGRLLERLWLVSGRVSDRLWKKSEPQPVQEPIHG